MSLGSVKLESFAPIRLEENNVVIQPLSGNDFTLKLNFLQFIRNMLMSTLDMQFPLMERNADGDFAVFSQGRLIGIYQKQPFWVVIQQLNLDHPNIKQVLSDDFALLKGETLLNDLEQVVQLDEATKMQFNSANGAIELIKHVEGVNYGLGLHPVYFLPTLIQSYESNTMQSDKGLTILAPVSIDGVITKATISNTLKGGALSFIVHGFDGQEPQAKSVDSGSDQQTQVVDFNVDFNQYQFSQDLLNQLFLKSVTFMMNVHKAKQAQVNTTQNAQPPQAAIS